MQYIRLAANVLFQNTVQFRRSGFGIQTQHDKAGKEVVSNNFLSWWKKAVLKECWNKQLLSQGAISVPELELCSGV